MNIHMFKALEGVLWDAPAELTMIPPPTPSHPVPIAGKRRVRSVVFIWDVTSI